MNRYVSNVSNDLPNYFSGNGIGSDGIKNITEKDFLSKKTFKIGSVVVELSMTIYPKKQYYIIFKNIKGTSKFSSPFIEDAKKRLLDENRYQGQFKSGGILDGGFEVFDYTPNRDIVIGYQSKLFTGFDVYIKLIVASFDDEVAVGEGDTEIRETYRIHDFFVEEIRDSDGEIVIMDEESKKKVVEEAKAYFDKYFHLYSFDDIVYDLESHINQINKFSGGGKVDDMMRISAKPFAFKEKLQFVKENPEIFMGKFYKNGGVVKKLFSNPDRFFNYNGMFLYPPRVEYKLLPASLDKFDNGEFIGQPKMNGSSCSVIISENSVLIKERHNKPFYAPPSFDFKKLHKGKGYMCLVGEFMNKSKKDHTKNAFKGFCIWDITAFNGKILIGSKIEERINLLNNLYPSGEALSTEGVNYLFKTSYPDIYKVNNFYDKFGEIYQKLIKVDMIEGFVLKRKSGMLQMMSRENNNTGWSVKVRKPTSNYEF